MKINLKNERKNALNHIIIKANQKTDKNTLTSDYLKILVKEIKTLIKSDF